MKLIFDGSDLLAIDGLHLVDIEWPAAPSKTVSELNMPAGNGSYYMGATLDPMDVTFKFRLDAGSRDPDAIAAKWAALAVYVSAKGLCDLTVSRPICEGYFVNLTYEAVPVGFTNLDYRGLAGEASITFRIPVPIGEDRDHAVTFKLPVDRYYNGTHHYTGSVVPFYPQLIPSMMDGLEIDTSPYGVSLENALGSYPAKINISGKVITNRAYAEGEMFRIKAWYSDYPIGAVTPTHTQWLKLLGTDCEVGSSYEWDILNDERTVRFSQSGSPYEYCLPTLDSDWLEQKPYDANSNRVHPDKIQWLFVYENAASDADLVYNHASSTLAATITPRWI